MSLYRKARPDELGSPHGSSRIPDGSSQTALVVHNGSSRHGKYADQEKRKAYRRDWMRAKRKAKS